MKLDMVHDIQTVYRKLVDAMARPGQLADLSKEAALIEENEARPFLLLAFTLFDQEVTFKVFSKREAAISKLIHQYTNARPSCYRGSRLHLCFGGCRENCLKGRH